MVETEIGRLNAFDPNARSMGLGCNTLGHIDSAEARRILFTALDRGVALFDTAASYALGRSEEELGRWLPPKLASSMIITKFGHPSSAGAELGATAPALAAQSLDESLRRLR